MPPPTRCQINSAGAINGGGLVTAATVDLNAA
jgi:hypothetical protein